MAVGRESEHGGRAGVRAPARGGRAALLLAASGALLAGCGDALGPADRFDAGEARDRVEAVVRPMEESQDLLLALDLAVLALRDHGYGALADAVALRSPGEARGGRGGLDGLREALPEGGSSGRSGVEGDVTPAALAVAALTVPSDLRGETLAWDPNGGFYVTGGSGAPSTGVRVLTYRMNASTGYPRVPLERVGHVDLSDASGSGGDGVRVRALRTVGPDRVVADYTVTLAGTGGWELGSLTWRARGELGESSGVTMDLDQRLEWDRSRDRDELWLEHRYGSGSRSVALDGRAVGPFEAVEWSTFDFGVALEAAYAADALVDAEVRADGSLRGGIRAGGREVIRIGGWDGSPTFERADGAPLGTWEASALRQLWTGITDLVWLTDWVMVPAELLGA